MAMALLTLSSLSQPVRALGRWLHRGFSTGATPPTGPRAPAPYSHSHGSFADQPAFCKRMDEAGVRLAPPARLRDGALSRSLGGAVAANAAQYFAAPAAAAVRTQQPQSTGRTVRVLHRGDATGPCRLVISGRMADVCAELDRMAAHEALQS